MIAVRWVLGLVRRRLGRLAAVASAVALAVALVGTLGSFVIFARSDIARRVMRASSVDWQVKLATETSPTEAVAGLAPSPGARAWEVVGYADVLGLRASVGGTVQTTGTAVVVGLRPSYAATFGGQIRHLIGARDGVLLTQQTAANLHAGPGDQIEVLMHGTQPARLAVDGIVDLPEADSFFQVVGAAPGTGPQAPPDNVVILPLDTWRGLFAPGSPGAMLQLHVKLALHLPADPARAYARLVAERRAYEVRMAGGAVVGDNLAARLDAARQDAAYGELLFLFLGLPGLAVAIALAVVAVAAGAERRRAEQALLRARGATPARLAWVAAGEALVVWTLAAPVGTAGASAAGRLLWGVGPRRSWAWISAAAVTGLAAAMAAVVVPAVRDARRLTVSASRRLPRATPRRGLAAAAWGIAAVAGAVVWATTRPTYQVVAAPEGVPTVSIGYLSLAGPAAAWVAGAIILTRLAVRGLASGRPVTQRMLQPVAGRLAGLVAAWLARLGTVVVRAVLLLGLAVAFAVSTAVFDATFSAQAEVDAQLTNGADVTVSAPQGVGLGDLAERVATLPGVRGVDTMQHRFAYVGNDLQDLYGIHPKTLGRATTIADAYFAGGRARQRLRELSRVTDGIFVAAETVSDYQLRPGDRIRIRMLDAQAGRYVTVPFQVLGVVREFPTAPTDSFLVANASYVAEATHSQAAETLLVRTDRRHTAAVAAAVRHMLPPGVGARVQDILHQRRITSSSLVALDMRGLSIVNLVFGAASTLWTVGLVVAVGFVERRRSFAILKALGGRGRQIAAFALSEAGAVVGLGLTAGAVLGAAVAWILVQVLHGVFDPPPQHPSVPWAYLILLVAAAGTGLAGAGAAALTRASRLDPAVLRGPWT